jgi:hypothetical protein
LPQRASGLLQFLQHLRDRLGQLLSRLLVAAFLGQQARSSPELINAIQRNDTWLATGRPADRPGPNGMRGFGTALPKLQGPTGGTLERVAQALKTADFVQLRVVGPGAFFDVQAQVGCGLSSHGITCLGSEFVQSATPTPPATNEGRARRVSVDDNFPVGGTCLDCARPPAITD